MEDHTPCIVVVEDDPHILSLVRDALEMEGFDSVGFNRAFNVETLSVDPALFVFDMMLPGQTGIELAQALRDEGYTTTPMVAMSASAAMIQHARRSGLFRSFLAKPFDLDQLLLTVERELAA